MKPLFLFLLAFTACTFKGISQEQDLKETARSFMRAGDFDNAILVLNKALQQDQNDLELQKELTLAYYYKRDYAKALYQIKPLLERNDADVITFQIAGNIYKALEEVKEADKLYKAALKKFPKSGALYSEYGELLLAKKDNSAINQWEKGIKEDPAHAGNYYNAALYYYNNKEKIWSIVYGEIFVNMESLTERAAAMKQIILDSYKENLFADADVMKDYNKTKSAFARAFLETMNKQSTLLSKGVTTETLTMIRTRFILDWFAKYSSKFPFKLFEYQQQLIREGMFEAYNQWLFGTVENLAAFDQWTKTYSGAYNKFTTFQKGRVFKLPPGQYYREL
ncbi:MAG: tetratricopeptide repeat protein [Chitinophagaceae bacterium]